MHVKRSIHLTLPSGPRLGFQGMVFHAHNPRGAFSPLSGAGAARYGGRFNPTGLLALHTPLWREAVWLEAQQGFAFKVQPLIICAYEINRENAADWTNPNMLADFGPAPASIDDFADCRAEGKNAMTTSHARRQAGAIERYFSPQISSKVSNWWTGQTTRILSFRSS